jgi:hypothetical protein
MINPVASTIISSPQNLYASALGLLLYELLDVQAFSARGNYLRGCLAGKSKSSYGHAVVNIARGENLSATSTVSLTLKL